MTECGLEEASVFANGMGGARERELSGEQNKFLKRQT